MSNRSEFRKYRDTATMLWLVAGVLLGLGAGSFANASAREYIFYVIAGVGIALLARLNWPQHRHGEDVAPDQVDKKTPVMVDRVLESSNDEPLKSDEAREWLDDFLQRQQRN